MNMGEGGGGARAIVCDRKRESEKGGVCALLVSSSIYRGKRREQLYVRKIREIRIIVLAIYSFA